MRSRVEITKRLQQKTYSLADYPVQRVAVKCKTEIELLEWILESDVDSNNFRRTEVQDCLLLGYSAEIIGLVLGATAGSNGCISDAEDLVMEFLRETFIEKK